MFEHIIFKVLARDPPEDGGGGGVGSVPNPAKEIVGNITSQLPHDYQPLTGIVLFFSNILRLVFLAAGIYAFLNFIVAGFQYMSAGGDSKVLTQAWNRIWQSLMGLVIIVGSFALAALFGYLIFGDASAILSPKVYGPAGPTGP